VWRVLNRSGTGFSRRQAVEGKLKQSRIDYRLVASRVLKEIRTCTYSFNSWSDHAFMTVGVGGEGTKKGGGIRCLNISHLEDEVSKTQINKYLRMVLQSIDFVDDICAYWGKVKAKIKRICILSSKNKN